MNRVEMLRLRREKATRTDDALKILFIGNSATYVHDIPQTLSRLAEGAGYHIEVTSIVKGGYELAQHANVGTEHGKKVYDQIRKGYDVVILQDNGNCVTSEEKCDATKISCELLHEAIRASGGETFFYVRPPYGTDHAGRTPFDQCVAFDDLFGKIAENLDIVCAYVNRAFAYAMTHLPFDLWGPDHAHTSERGAYLAVCVFFATLFGVSSAALATNDLPTEDAGALQTVADKIALETFLPW